MIFNILKMSSFRNCMRSSDITTSPVQWVVTGKNQRMIIIFSCRNVLIYHSVQDRQRTHRSVIKRLGWCQDLSLAHPSSTHPASRLAVRPWPPIGQFSLTSVTLGQSEPTWRPIGRGRGEWLRNFPLADQFCGQFWANKENNLRRSLKLQHCDGHLYPFFSDIVSQ